MRSFSPPVFVTSAVECDGSHPRTDACGFRVAWAINPYMRPGSGDLARARAQATAFAATLRAEGAEVIELPFVHGAFDSVFMKDPVVLVEHKGARRALLAHHRFAERRVERSARARALATLGFDPCEPAAEHWEGGDLVLAPHLGVALFGHGPRSSLRAAAWLERMLAMPIVPLALRDARLFHLDMALSVLPDRSVLVCRDAFEPGALGALANLAVHDVVSVPPGEALAFGLNLVPIGDAVLTGADAPFVRRVLRQRGLRPVRVTLDEFHLAGGSAACLVARVHRPASDARTPRIRADATRTISKSSAPLSAR